MNIHACSMNIHACSMNIHACTHHSYLILHTWYQEFIAIIDPVYVLYVLVPFLYSIMS